MNAVHAKLLMEPATGDSDSYRKPSNEDMVQEYAEAISALTILGKLCNAVKRDEKNPRMI
jgi:hypothetical protein